MGATCSGAQAIPPPGPKFNRPNATSPTPARSKSTRPPGMAPNIPRPTSRAYQQPSPILLDSETHAIRSLSSSQFQIVDVHPSSVVPSRSPTRRPTIVPRDGHPSNRISTRVKLDKPCEILFRDLTFKQTLGQGTYGEVSRGYWKGRKVAIKKIFPGTNSDERIAVVADFERELAILSKLRHPRIVQFLGAVNEQNQPLCLIFELCEGSAALLLKMVRRGQVHLTWRVCLGILRDTAEAVHSLHSQSPKIIHRDLKAENLLLESDFRCKLTDFGLSRPFDARRPSQMTVCGTPCWVAPEIFRNEAYDEKVDVYSFGILVWEILAARKPYSEKDCADLPVLVGSKGLRPGLLSHVPAEVNELMTACWDEHPYRRPDFDRMRRWLDHIAYVVDYNRRMSYPVHVTSYTATNWDLPPVAFDYMPPMSRESKRISAQRIRRHDGNSENNMRRHNTNEYQSVALV